VKPQPYADLAETHISTVFFAGDRAYKLLKPLRTGFLDHTSVEQREEACRREVELNRRLAPDVYLGVSPILEHEPVSRRDVLADHLIVMRRLPADRRLTKLVHGPERDDAIRAVARAVAAFHAAQPPDDRAARAASRRGVNDLWSHNLDEMQEFVDEMLPGETMTEIASLVERYLAGGDAPFESRLAPGLARDGPGDRQAEDNFHLEDGPRILDCLAFDDDLRVGDVLLDVAFLAMDLERLAGRDAADLFLRHYQEMCAEHHPRSLAHHYIAYRALVRAKVSCLRAEQGAAEAVGSARGYLHLAVCHLRAARPRLVLVGGSPGTGKTTTATDLSASTGFVLLSSDELRKDLAGVAHVAHAYAPFGEGIYTPTMTLRTYEELLAHARTMLCHGESVILDASWTSGSLREAARAIAEETSSDIVELRCVLDPVLAGERIARRSTSETNVSDATPAVAANLALAADPWPEATELDTRRSPQDVVAIARAIVGTS
jgi:aminoglycoside phosphotransferase family enzyme/adenylate kinase family enzyme